LPYHGPPQNILLSKEKSINDLLNMLAGYLPQNPNAMFLLVGSGSDIDALKKLTRELGISEQVILL